MLSDAEVAELTMLRRRAFGPDADIARDPFAVRRLEQLESAARAEATWIAAPAAERDRGAGGATPAEDPAPDEAAVDVVVPVSSRHTDVAQESAEREPDASEPDEGEPDERRRRWPARVVVGAGVPVAALLLAGGFVFGAGSIGPGPGATPTPTPSRAHSPSRPGFADSYAWARFVRTWDPESLRILARFDDTRVWVGTVGDGASTCVAIDDQRADPVVCRITTDVGDNGITVEAPRSREDDTVVLVYVVNPYAEPAVMVDRVAPDVPAPAPW